MSVATNNCWRGKAVIFDLDGTLLDTLEDIGASVNEALKSLGFPEHPIGNYCQFIGDGWAMLTTRALPKDARTPKIIEDCIARSREIYADNWNNRTHFYKGIPDLLDALTATGVSLAMVSNKPHEFTLRYAEAYLSKWPFKSILGQTKAFKPKPDPGSSLETARRLGISPLKFFFVGDSGVDMKTAVAAGMHPVGVAWGFRNITELQDCGCRSIIYEPMQLIELIKYRAKQSR